MEKVVERIPSWALCYIVNGDPEGLTNEDLAQVQGFYDSYRKAGYQIEIISPHEDDEGYFSRYPAFGLPGDVIDCDVLYTSIKQNDNRKD